jgi:hypothetical protein
MADLVADQFVVFDSQSHGLSSPGVSEVESDASVTRLGTGVYAALNRSIISTGGVHFMVAHAGRPVSC